MAAAEVRTAWQRANRCLVQEDAKRAPKLACCSSSSTSQNEASIGNQASTKDRPASSFMPLSRIPMNLDLSPDTKWWLQIQPNFGYQKDLIYVQLSSLEDKLIEEVENQVAASKPSWKSLDNFADFDIEMDGCSESPIMVSTASMKHSHETRIKTTKVTNFSQQLQKSKVDLGDYLCKGEDVLDMKSAHHVISKKKEKASPEPDRLWAGTKKSEPWWHIADQDELALLVAQKSLQHIENCDLPRPTQTVQYTMDPYSSPDYPGTVGMFPSHLDKKLPAGMPNINEFSKNSSTSGRSDNENLSAAEGGYLLHSSKYYRYTQDSPAVRNDSVESSQSSGDDPGRAELLEALCHSQTRARKAEMTAKKAIDEKDHIIKLLFRQASHLFAYKQWLQILQLESLCLQLKDHQMSAFVPVLPWMPLKGKPFRKARSNPKRWKGLKRNICIFCEYTVVFAIGIGMVGAGLLLGWTLGWLLPTF